MRGVARVDAEVARAVIAAAMLPVDAVETVGSVSLWPRQRATLTRVLDAIERSGGALVADDVGSGKTFVALAAAARFREPLIVAPAALRDVWSRAKERTGVVASFLSIEALSRGADTSAGASPDLVIVDEAHHARNPATRRYQALARLTSHARVLLLTATPVHNSARDLQALLALFLGSRAHALDDADIARCVIRGGRDHGSNAENFRVPRVDGPASLALDHDDAETAERIVALPPAVPPADGGVAHALSLLVLLRQWSSSDGALRAGLRRRLTSGQALADALATGWRPTRRDLALWTLGDGAQQLAFAELFASGDKEATATGELHERLARHVEGLRDLLARCRSRPSLDAARADAIRALRCELPDEKIIAFTQFAETAAAYWSHLRSLPHVATLTARGGNVAGGAISRRVALRRFSPRSLGANPPPRSERIDCLIATDILSEGLDLQDASVVVHLDQPWTAARLEQRVGRVVRPGGAHERVVVRVMPPPVRAEVVLQMEARLRAKLEAARRSLGDVMPLALGDVGSVSPSPVAASSRTASLLARWRQPAEPRASVLAVVRTHVAGWLAAVERDGYPMLVARIGDDVGEDPGLIAHACELAEGLDARDDTLIEPALEAIDRWLSCADAARLAGVAELAVADSRSSLARAASAVARLPRSRRTTLAPRADLARVLANAPGGLGRERELALLAARELDGLGDETEPRPAQAFRAGKLIAAIVFSSAD